MGTGAFRTIFITAFFFNHPRGCDIHSIMAPDHQGVSRTLVVISYESLCLYIIYSIILKGIFTLYSILGGHRKYSKRSYNGLYITYL